MSNIWRVELVEIVFAIKMALWLFLLLAYVAAWVYDPWWWSFGTLPALRVLKAATAPRWNRRSRMEARLKAVYTIVEGERLDRPSYRRIGTAFRNRDSSLSIYLDALPLSGRLHVREIDLRDDEGSRDEARRNVNEAAHARGELG